MIHPKALNSIAATHAKVNYPKFKAKVYTIWAHGPLGLRQQAVRAEAEKHKAHLRPSKIGTGLRAKFIASVLIRTVFRSIFNPSCFQRNRFLGYTIV